MPLAVFRQPFDHPDWIFELWDGFRALAYLENGRARLISRRGNVYKTFGALCEGLAESLPIRDAILDGEIVHLDDDGRPQFLSLLRRRSPSTLRSV